MPRKRLIRTNEFPYHVSARSNNKDWFAIPLPEVWNVLNHYLTKTIEKYQISPHCFVLMNNHFHLLLSTPRENIDRAMGYLLTNMSLEIGKLSGRINRIFGGRYCWSIVQDEKYYFHVYRYIYQKPLRAGISEDIMDYPFHSLNYLCGNQGSGGHDIHNEIESLKPLKPLCKDILQENRRKYLNFYFSNDEEEIHWINQIYSTKDQEAIRNGLRQSHFQLAPIKTTKKKMVIPLDLPRWG